MGSYDDFLRQVQQPLLAKIYNAIKPVLQGNQFLNDIDSEFIESVLYKVSDRATDIFLSESAKAKIESDRKRQKEKAEAEFKIKMNKIMALRKMSIDDFRVFITNRYESIIKEKNNHKSLIFDAYNEKAFNLLLHYFSGRASEVGLNPNKGICLLGPSGAGKSEMMKSFEDNPFHSFRMFLAPKLIKAAISNYDYYLGKLSTEKSINEAENIFGETAYSVCIDEFGKGQYEISPKGDNFKNSTVNFMYDMIVDADENHSKLFIISNFPNIDKIADFYDESTARRVFEACNIIEFSQESPNRSFV